jgi:signal transduction histidine kinase
MGSRRPANSGDILIQLRQQFERLWNHCVNAGIQGHEDEETATRIRLVNRIRFPAMACLATLAMINLVQGATANFILESLTLTVWIIGSLVFQRQQHRVIRSIGLSAFFVMIVGSQLIYGQTVFAHYHMFTLIAAMVLFYEDQHFLARFGPYFVIVGVSLCIMLAGNLFGTTNYPMPPLFSQILDLVLSGIFTTLSFHFLRKENLASQRRLLEEHKALNYLNSELVEAKKLLEDSALKMAHKSKMTAIGELGSGLAHEINNPLTVTMGNLHLILSEFERAEPSKEHTIKLATIALEHSKRIQTIVKALRHYSSNWEDSTPEDFDLQDLLRDTTALVISRFREAGTDLLISIGSGPIIINGRPAHLSQAILALLLNAYEATENMTDRWINIVVDCSEQMVQIKFIDSGSGISPAIQEKLMQPFFTTKDVGQGQGLGLSTARAIVTQHNGELDYDPTCEKTCFIMTLPRKSTETRRKAG